jgi:Na+-transporting methylmalonyl-CoA/oxaloacetate decarboxylase gamma subunit
MNTIQAFGWSEIGWITLIGFSLVFLLLVCLIGVLTVFGVVATYKKKEKKPAAATTAPAKEQEEEHMVSEAKVAAIAIALNLYRGAMHDQESEVITIQAIKRAYSPWNSKIHSLTQLPERK